VPEVRLREGDVPRSRGAWPSRTHLDTLPRVGHEDVLEEALLVLNPGGAALLCEGGHARRCGGDIERFPRVGLKVVDLGRIGAGIVDELARLIAIAEKHP